MKQKLQSGFLSLPAIIIIGALLLSVVIIESKQSSSTSPNIANEVSKQDVVDVDFQKLHADKQEKDTLSPKQQKSITDKNFLTYYLNATTNLRSCAGTSCEKLGTYPINAEFSLPYTSIDEMPDWVLITYPKSDGSPTEGYIYKEAFSNSKKKISITDSTKSETLNAPANSILCNNKFWSPCLSGQFTCPKSGDAYCSQPAIDEVTSLGKQAESSSELTEQQKNKVFLAITEWLMTQQEYKRKQSQFDELKSAYDSCNSKYDIEITPARKRYIELSTQYNSTLNKILSADVPPGAIQNQLTEFTSGEGSKIHNEMDVLSAKLTGLTENKNSECSVYYTLITGQPVYESKTYSQDISNYLTNTSVPKAQDLNCRIIQHSDVVSGIQYETRCDGLQCITKNGSGGSYSSNCY